jgi:hypothetical protein
MNAQLHKAIESFGRTKYARKAHSPSWATGECDSVSLIFLKHAHRFGLRGYLLAIDHPKVPLKNSTWDIMKDHVSHFIAYFPDLSIGVDWTARQFWSDAPVPKISTKKQILAEWRELPFDWCPSEDLHGHNTKVAYL